MSLEEPKTIADAVAAQAAATKAPHFLIVYASIVGDKSWCGDCVAAEPLIKEKFSGDAASRLTVQYAGDRET